MRSFSSLKSRAFKNVYRFAGDFFLLLIIFLNENSAEQVYSGRIVAQHVNNIFFAVIVMENRRIKSGGIKINRF